MMSPTFNWKDPNNWEFYDKWMNTFVSLRGTRTRNLLLQNAKVGKTLLGEKDDTHKFTVNDTSEVWKWEGGGGLAARAGKLSTAAETREEKPRPLEGLITVQGPLLTSLVTTKWATSRENLSAGLRSGMTQTGLLRDTS